MAEIPKQNKINKKYKIAMIFALFLVTIPTSYQKIFSFFSSILWKSLTFEPLIQSSSVIPFWNPQNVSYNIGHFKQLWTRILVFGSDRVKCYTLLKWPTLLLSSFHSKISLWEKSFASKRNFFSHKTVLWEKKFRLEAKFFSHKNYFSVNHWSNLQGSYHFGILRMSATT